MKRIYHILDANTNKRILEMVSIVSHYPKEHQHDVYMMFIMNNSFHSPLSFIDIGKWTPQGPYEQLIEIE